MSYYDTTKNQYILVPTTKNKYFTNDDMIEKFDNFTSLNSEEDNSNIATLVEYLDGNKPKFKINNNLPAKIQKNIKFKGNMENFTNSQPKLTNITKKSGGDFSSNSLPKCFDGNTLYSSVPYETPGGSGFQDCKDKCVGEFSDTCVGVVEHGDDPVKGKITCKLKSNMSSDTSGVDNQNCLAYPLISSDTSGSDPIKKFSSDDGDLAKLLNPPLPTSGAKLDSVSTDVWSGQGQANVDIGTLNQINTESECSWNWDGKCLPQDVNYGNNNSNPNNRSVLPLPPSCQMDGLNPNTPALMQSGDGNYFMYIDGRKMKISKEAVENGCYSAKYWMDSNVRKQCLDDANCNLKLTGAKKVGGDLSEACFNDIPIVEGNNISGGGSIDCRSDLRPSQRVGIKNNLFKEANKWSNIGRKNAMLYNTKSVVSSSKYGEMNKINQMLRRQVDNSQSNKYKLDNLNNTIYNQVRQVQISNDDTRRKNENLFLLKLLLTYLLIVAIPLIIKASFDKFKTKHLILIILFISIPFIYLLTYNLYSIRHRSPMRWPLKNWPTGPLPDDSASYHTNNDENEKPQCPEPESKIDACKQEAKALEQEIDEIENNRRKLEMSNNQLSNRESTLQSQLCKAKKCIPGQKCDEPSNSNLGFNMNAGFNSN